MLHVKICTGKISVYINTFLCNLPHQMDFKLKGSLIQQWASTSYFVALLIHGMSEA